MIISHLCRIQCNYTSSALPELVAGNASTQYCLFVGFDTVRAANNGDTPVRDSKLSRRLNPCPT
ncbi:hypothetical protein JW960_21430 [candidate division KSB1 bacterium]|nr:hypothetical protein [candidate division KSB1 bacterium]